MPKVSILIPTYNYADFLDETIRSVLHQTYKDFELIIVDNNSSDHTQQVVEKYLRDPRVFFYKNERNVGLVENWNKCLEYARGEYIKFLCADDKFHPRLLEKFVPVMEKFPTVSIVTSYRQTFGLRTKTITTPTTGLQNGGKVIFDCLFGGKGNHIGEPTTVMFRRSGLKVGKFDPAYLSIVDFNMWLRLLTIGDLYVIPEVLSYFRIHEIQVTTEMHAKNILEEYRFYKSITTINPYNIDPGKIGLRETIRAKAIRCGKTMFRLLPFLGRNKDRQTFKDAAKIALKERVVSAAFVELLRGSVSSSNASNGEVFSKTLNYGVFKRYINRYLWI